MTQEQKERLAWLLALRDTCIAKGQKLTRKKTDELNNLLLIERFANQVNTLENVVSEIKSE